MVSLDVAVVVARLWDSMGAAGTRFGARSERGRRSAIIVDGLMPDEAAGQIAVRASPGRAAAVAGRKTGIYPQGVGGYRVRGELCWQDGCRVDVADGHWPRG